MAVHASEATETAQPPSGGGAVSVAEERGFDQVCLPLIKTAGEHGKIERALYGYFPQGNNHTGVFIRWMRGYLRALTRESDNTKARKQLHGIYSKAGYPGWVSAADVSSYRAAEFRGAPVAPFVCEDEKVYLRWWVASGVVALNNDGRQTQSVSAGVTAGAGVKALGKEENHVCIQQNSVRATDEHDKK